RAIARHSVPPLRKYRSRLDLGAPSHGSGPGGKRRFGGLEQLTASLRGGGGGASGSDSRPPGGRSGLYGALHVGGGARSCFGTAEPRHRSDDRDMYTLPHAYNRLERRGHRQGRPSDPHSARRGSPVGGTKGRED